MLDFDTVAAPDSALTRAATDLLLATSPQTLVNHCYRVYQWGAVLGDRRAWRIDPELYFLGSALHDLGLTARFDGREGFEIQGAVAAAEFLLEQGYPEKRIELVREAIRLHIDLETYQDPRPEVALLSMAAGLDTGGYRYKEIDPAFMDVVLKSWPRLEFRKWLLKACRAEAERKPASKVAEWITSGRLHDNSGNPPFTE
ncbi:HD domain-containing protein [Nocardia sp. XZ_19_369]|uniref:HD domain-containing protein n=1 Tax=Nocardia sp. XZ_19_369 TaxID=2769487 RepID=UPI00188FCF0D|nr:HD domain-containing protein [Nocardia sp. XZ_19_369]